MKKFRFRKTKEELEFHEPVKYDGTNYEYIKQRFNLVGVKKDHYGNIVDSKTGEVAIGFNSYVICFAGEKLYAFNDLKSLRGYMKEVHLFQKDQRSSFKYWFAHWCAFQMLALNLGVWKPRHLLHDIEKPWLKLWYRKDYKKVQKWHREHNSHHLEYGKKKGWNKLNAIDLIIDWECSALTKYSSQLDARQTLEIEVNGKWKEDGEAIKQVILPVLDQFGL